MTNDEINEYLDTDEPYDKAGAYGIQGYGAKYIKKIDGDYYSVMGMPLQKLYNKLIDSGISIHPNGKLEKKPWNQMEFSIIDPNGTLLTFGQFV